MGEHGSSTLLIVSLVGKIFFVRSDSAQFQTGSVSLVTSMVADRQSSGDRILVCKSSFLLALDISWDFKYNKAEVSRFYLLLFTKLFNFRVLEFRTPIRKIT